MSSFFLFFYLITLPTNLNGVIQLGSVNLIVITDTHSWIHGHKHPDNVPSSDATYGDLISFVHHMKLAADAAGHDLFFMDNGDVVDGTALSNITPNDGEALFPILKDMPFDALNIGNHELYSNTTIEALKITDYVKHWNGKYLTTNTFLSETQQPIGSRYTILKGKHGANLLVFGFLYNMMDHCEAVIVETVQKTIKQSWFKNTIQNENYDAIVVLAHMHVTDPLLNVILNAIRQIKGPNIIIQFITGHSHIRAFHQLDPFASSFEAGKYFDTVGFISFNLTNIPSEHNIFNPVYIDSNKNEFIKISNTNINTFTILESIIIDKKINTIRNNLNIDKAIGCSTESYDTNAKIEDKNSLWNFYINNIIPTVLFEPSYNSSQILFQSTGSFRYDLYAGEWTIDDIWTLSPFADVFYIIENIPGKDLEELYIHINNKEKSHIDHKLRTPISYKLPNYVTTSIPITNKIYDLICVGFDHKHFLDTLTGITGLQYSSHIYNKHMNDTSVWFSWVDKNLPKVC
eukprot:gene498-946_t